MSKDWTGNGKSMSTVLGSSHHSEEDRELNDYYATDPKAAELLLQYETFTPMVWEPSCGEGHLSKVFEAAGYDVKSSDLIDRGYGEAYTDFLSLDITVFTGDIITNPPYKFAQEFIEKSLQIIPDGCKVAMFLKIQFMEGKRRKHLFLKYPPKVIYVSSSRINCAKNGNFQGMRETGGSAIAYAWYVWQKGYAGDSVIKWIN